MQLKLKQPSSVSTTHGKPDIKNLPKANSSSAKPPPETLKITTTTVKSPTEIKMPKVTDPPRAKQPVAPKPIPKPKPVTAPRPQPSNNIGDYRIFIPAKGKVTIDKLNGKKRRRIL